MTKQEIIELIQTSGCKMLEGMTDGDETKEELVAHLKRCKCPVIKSYL